MLIAPSLIQQDDMQDGMQDEFHLNCVSMNLQEMLAITLISTCASCCFILRADFNASAHMLEPMLLAFYRSFFLPLWLVFLL